MRKRRLADSSNHHNEGKKPRRDDVRPNRSDLLAMPTGKKRELNPAPQSPPKRLRSDTSARPPVAKTKLISQPVKQQSPKQKSHPVKPQPPKLVSQPVKPRAVKLVSQPVKSPDELASSRRLRAKKPEAKEGQNAVDVRKEADLKKASSKDKKKDAKKSLKKDRDARKDRSLSSAVPTKSELKQSSKTVSSPGGAQNEASHDRRRKDFATVPDSRRISVPRSRLSSEPTITSKKVSDREQRDGYRPSKEVVRPSPNNGESDSPTRNYHPRDRDSVRKHDKDRDRERDHNGVGDRRGDKLRDRNSRDRGSDHDRGHDRIKENCRKASSGGDRVASRSDRPGETPQNRGKGRERDVGKRERERDTRRERERPRDGSNYDDGKRERARERDWERDREYPKERSNGLRSLPVSRSESGKGSGSVGHSPAASKVGVSNSKRGEANGRAQSVVSHKDGIENRAPGGYAELSQILKKQKDLYAAFEEVSSRCDEYYKKKEYDAYQEAAKTGFRLYFNFSLAKETELRLKENELKKMSGTERMNVKKEVLDYYRKLTKNYAPTRISELEKIGRRSATGFYKRGIQKVYLRMFALQRLWEKEQRQTDVEVKKTIIDALSVREADSRGNRSTRNGDEEISTRKLGLIKRMVEDYGNVLSILESVVNDYGDGFEEAGAECFIP